MPIFSFAGICFTQRTSGAARKKKLMTVGICNRLRPLLRPHAAGNKDQQTCIQKSQNQKISNSDTSCLIVLLRDFGISCAGICFTQRTSGAARKKKLMIVGI